MSDIHCLWEVHCFFLACGCACASWVAWWGVKGAGIAVAHAAHHRVFPPIDNMPAKHSDFLNS